MYVYIYKIVIVYIYMYIYITSKHSNFPPKTIGFVAACEGHNGRRERRIQRTT